MNATIRNTREHLLRKEQKKTKEKNHQKPAENKKKNIKELWGRAKSTEIMKIKSTWRGAIMWNCWHSSSSTRSYNRGDRSFFIAPAEGNTPLNIFFDKNAEEMSFPTIFCGKNRAENTEREVNVSYGDICKSELRNVDRRVASHIPNIFF